MSMSSRCLDENHAVCLLIDNPYNEITPNSAKTTAWQTSGHGVRRHAALPALKAYADKNIPLVPWMAALTQLATCSTSALHILLRLDNAGVMHEGLKLAVLSKLLFGLTTGTVRSVVLHVVVDSTSRQLPETQTSPADDVTAQLDRLSVVARERGYSFELGLVVGARLACPEDGLWHSLRNVMRTLRSGQPRVVVEPALELGQHIMSVLQHHAGASLELLAPEYHCSRPLAAEDTLLLYSLDPFGLRQLYFCLTIPEVHNRLEPLPCQPTNPRAVPVGLSDRMPGSLLDGHDASLAATGGPVLSQHLLHAAHAALSSLLHPLPCAAPPSSGHSCRR